ncbi:hypothetical protein GKR41_00616 [Candidatus Vallotia lariciata]|nr:hypothetical protein GKR41_00616 [Candidatus Vallotia lariciata]
MDARLGLLVFPIIKIIHEEFKTFPSIYIMYSHSYLNTLYQSIADLYMLVKIAMLSVPKNAMLHLTIGN